MRLDCFDPAAEDFGDAPGLGDAAAGCERRLGIEDFTDGADAGFIHVGCKALEKFPGPGAVLGIDTEPGVNKWTYQPRPNGALVVGCVAGAQVAEVFRFVIGMIAAQRAKSHRR